MSLNSCIPEPYHEVNGLGNTLRSRIFLSFVFAAVVAVLLGRDGYAAPRPQQPPVEVFDVKQEKVVHTLPMTKSLHKKLLRALHESPQPYGGISVNPTDGIVVHAVYPLPVKLRDPVYPEPISELYLFLAPKQTPLALLFFSHGHRPRVYTLQADAERLIKAVQPER